MGSLLSACCPCGYASPRITAGGGFRDFQTVCAAPAVCLACKEVVEVNIKAAETACPKCGGPTTLCGEITSSRRDRCVFDWNISETQTYVLEDRAYRCPLCDRETLKFQEEGCWD